MLTAEKLAALLEAEGHDTRHGLMCDEGGLALICGASERSVRRWRTAGKLPDHLHLACIAWDLEEIAAWLNQGGLDFAKKTASVATIGRSCPSHPAGKRRKIAATS